MVESRIPLAELIYTAIMVVGFLIALVVINHRAEGRSRRYGVSGLVALAASAFLLGANDSQGSVYGTDTTLFTVLTVLVGVLAAGGLVLLAMAVGRARLADRPRGDHR